MLRTSFVLFGVLALAGLIGGCDRTPSSTAAAENPPASAVTCKKFVGKPGHRIKLTREGKTVNTSVYDFLGEKKQSRQTSEETVIFVTEVLEVEKNWGAPTKLRRTFEKAETRSAGATTKMPLDGKTVLVEQRGGAFAFTIEGSGSVTGASLAEFSGEFNSTPAVTDFDSYFPDAPCKPGDTWDLKTRVLGGPFDRFELIREQTTCTGKLEKCYSKAGATFGVIETRAGGPFSGIKQSEIRVLAGSKLCEVVRGDGCIDGTRPDRTTVRTLTIQNNFVNLNAHTEIVATRKAELLPRP